MQANSLGRAIRRLENDCLCRDGGKKFFLVRHVIVSFKLHSSITLEKIKSFFFKFSLAISNKYHLQNSDYTSISLFTKLYLFQTPCNCHGAPVLRLFSWAVCVSHFTFTRGSLLKNSTDHTLGHLHSCLHQTTENTLPRID